MGFQVVHADEGFRVCDREGLGGREIANVNVNVNVMSLHEGCQLSWDFF